MADLPQALLATAALLIHVGLLAGAPLVSDLASATELVLTGRAARPLADGWRTIASRAGAGRPSPASLACFGLTAAASLLVPSFATGMLTAPLDDLPVVAMLLMAARLACTAALADPVRMGRSLALVVLAVPALLLAAAALASIAGNTGIDGAIASAPVAMPVPLGLAAVAIGLIAVADGDEGVEPGLTGATLALATASSSLRLLVWLDLLAGLLPPWSTTMSAAGPASWLEALLLWPLKVGTLAVLVGIARVVLGAARQTWRRSALRTASLLSLLSFVFVLIGQSLE